MSLATALSHAQLRNHFHACAFVTGPAEERAVIDPFFVEGMRRGEKAVYIVDPDQRDEHEARLAASAPSPDLARGDDLERRAPQGRQRSTRTG